jgi:myo-inositol-1-phosphate synthase
MSKQEKIRVALIGIGSWSSVIANAVQRSKTIEMAT